jgi:hypothetical protein
MLTAAQLSNLVYALTPHHAVAILSELAAPSAFRDGDAVAVLAGAFRAVAKDPAHVFTADEARAIHAAVRALD